MLPLLLAVSLAAQVPDSAHLVLVATTDAHGHATAWDYLAHRPYPGGLVRVATAVDSLRRRYPGQVVVLDAGDLLQGSPLAEYRRRAGPQDPDPLIEAMNLVGYDAATPGDRDLQVGMDALRQEVGAAAFPWVSANLRLEPAGTPAFQPSAVVQRQGVRVGITGFTTPGAAVWNRGRLRGTRVVRLEEAAGPVLTGLRRDADVVVALVHAGLGGASSYDTTGIGPEQGAAAIAGLPVRPDLVVLGHSHRAIRDTTLGGVHFVQPKPDALELAVVHLDLVRQQNRWRIVRVRSEPLDLSGVGPSALLEQRLAPLHAAAQAWVDQPLGLAPAPLPSTAIRAQPAPLLDFVLETERRASGAQLASAAPGDLRAGLPADTVRRSDLLRLYPGDRTLVALRLTGPQLRSYLEWSARYFRVDPAGRISLDDAGAGSDYEVVRGARYDIDLTRPVGDRIRNLSVGGRPLADGDSVTLALDQRRATGAGGYGMLRGAPVVYDRGQRITELLEAEVARGGADSAARPASQWRIVPEVAAVAVRNLFGVAPPPLARSASDTVAFRLLAIGDVGDELTAYAGGLGRAMDSLGQACACPTLRVDAGGSLQDPELLGALGTAAGVPSVAAFDRSPDTLRARAEASRVPWVAANASGAAGGWLAPFKVVEAAGLRVAVLGYVTPEVQTAQPAERLGALRFGEGELALHDALAGIRRAAPGLTVLLAYADASCDSLACEGEVVRLAEQLGRSGVDLIVAGRGLHPMDTRVAGIPIVGPGGPGGLAVADLVKTPAGGREVRVRVERVGAVAPAAGTPLAAAVRSAEIRRDSVEGRVVARLKAPVDRGGRQDAVGAMVAAARRNAGRADLGLVRDASVRDGVAAGPVTLGGLRGVAPGGEPLVRLSLGGREVREMIERTLDDSAGPSAHLAGAVVRYDPRGAPGRRVRSVTLAGGRKLENDASYTMVTDAATASGAGGLLPGGRSGERLGLEDADAMAAYLRRLPQPVEIGPSVAFESTR
ncbi:MAG TPA: 5'-nucleotidase C-terminal domain-containing protein [Gemmatimonadales bacterium]|nr:5'-nucleotidase C-terminal domain-containing protein [Gemmatimonadales bacterium]